MKKTNLLLCLCILLGAAVTAHGQGKRGLAFIKIPAEETVNYTNPSLRKFMQDNEGAAVIVRDLAGSSDKVQDASLSQATGTARICQLLEQGLLKNGFNVRDRQLFEAVADKADKNMDYAELYSKTGVDIIFEVTSFNWDRYEVNHYYQNREQKPFDPKLNAIVYDLYGFSIELKIIMLQNNVVGGTYKYYYTPCDETQGGCLITKLGKTSITYIPLESATPEVLGDNLSNKKGKGKDKGKNEDRISARIESRYEKFEKTVVKFITNTVIPSIVADIRSK
ncbi:MAG: hypothetical protein LBN98_05740 [Prevotellaceae bacterium]|jgi:hypothetical protein|nr:hypothetical protein [Prevotellaceae bacterium]